MVECICSWLVGDVPGHEGALIHLYNHFRRADPYIDLGQHVISHVPERNDPELVVLGTICECLHPLQYFRSVAHITLSYSWPRIS